MISKKTDRIIRIIIVVAAIITVAGMSYALLNTTAVGEKKYVFSNTGLKVYLDETKNLSDIIGEDSYPVPDEYGLEQDAFIFSVHNDSKTAIDYSIYLIENASSTMPSYGIRYNLNNKILELNKTDYINANDDNVGHLLYTSSLRSGFTHEYELKLWLGERAGDDCKNKSFSAHVSIESVQSANHKYVESILNGTDPILKGSLIPVTISSTGVVKKTNIYKKWYNYEKNIWANAVILKDESKNFNDDETIPEEDIESYFVWIPKYDYQIFNTGNYTALATKIDATQIINVRFGLDNTVNNDTECKYPVVNNQAVAGEGFDNCAIGKWMTHPAFTTMDVPGFWVGKFETGYNGATTTATAQVDMTYVDNIIIKPNVYSWRNITVGKIFNISYNYMRNLDSHMMKNTEWGAVSYLSASKYGYKDSINVDNPRKIAMHNNNSAYITGYSAISEPTSSYTGSSTSSNRYQTTALGVDGTYTINYLNVNSQVASTTGNYSGIYDMSGGSWEYVMGYTTGATTVAGSSGIFDYYIDFLNDTTYFKYWDRYSSTANTDWNNRILGDATGEMGPIQNTKDYTNSNNESVYTYKSSWYNDRGQFINKSNPWFAKGGQAINGTGTGVFASSIDDGAIDKSISFRIVLSPAE